MSNEKNLCGVVILHATGAYIGNNKNIFYKSFSKMRLESRIILSKTCFLHLKILLICTVSFFSEKFIINRLGKYDKIYFKILLNSIKKYSDGNNFYITNHML